MTLAMANGWLTKWLTKWLTIYSETIRSHSGTICLNTQKNQLFLNLKSRLPWPILTVGSNLFNFIPMMPVARFLLAITKNID
jgi:hypothetical protein